jgi:hypothetical protein
VESADPARRLDLGRETLPELPIGRQLGTDDLDGHRPAAGRTSQEHHTHAAVPETRFKPIAADRPRITVCRRFQ